MALEIRPGQPRSALLNIAEPADVTTNTILQLNIYTLLYKYSPLRMIVNSFLSELMVNGSSRRKLVQDYLFLDAVMCLLYDVMRAPELFHNLFDLPNSYRASANEDRFRSSGSLANGLCRRYWKSLEDSFRPAWTDRSRATGFV